MSEFLLEVEGVDKGFPGVQALKDMRLTLRHGEVLALVGENGAGKSTLMKLLSGIYSPDAGSFSFEGKPYLPDSPRHALESGISIIHQEFNLMPDLTVAQNVFIGREPRSGPFLSDRALNRRASTLVERLGLPLDVRRLVGNLTVAKQQMVEIAKALSYDARVLIMDEPTAALNDAEVQTLHDLIRRFVSPHTGVIYISHRMDELKAISDRITVIRDGQYVDTLGHRDHHHEGGHLAHGGTHPDPGRATVGVRTDRRTVLSVEGLSTRGLLRDITFDLRKGEILASQG
jgi:ribose transport system ATP-binding protein